LDEVDHYVARSVLPAMGIAGRPFTLRPPAEAGTRSSLRLIEPEGMPPLLLRIFDHRTQAARNAGALRHLESLDLPAPRLVFHEGWRSRITVETWVEGTRHAGITEPARARAAALSVASLLATYHRVTRDRWGRPDTLLRPKLISFAAATLRAARGMTAALRGQGWLEGAQATSIEQRLGTWRQTIADITSYSLVHNDANRHNFIVSAAGAVTPIDLHRLAYEPFPEELINALYHFCRKDAELAERFVERYFAKAGETARSAFDRTRGFFEPLNFLKKMHRRAAGSPPAGDPKMLRWRERVAALEAAT